MARPLSGDGDERKAMYDDRDRPKWSPPNVPFFEMNQQGSQLRRYFSPRGCGREIWIMRDKYDSGKRASLIDLSVHSGMRRESERDSKSETELV